MNISERRLLRVALKAAAISAGSLAVFVAILSQRPAMADMQTPEMTPLNQYLEENSSNGDLGMVELRYVYLRCLGILGMTSQAIADNTQATAGDLRRRVQHATSVHMVAFQRTHKVLQPDDVDLMFFQANFKVVLDLYTDRAMKSRGATGMIFSDTLLRDDLNLCLETAEATNQ